MYYKKINDRMHLLSIKYCLHSYISFIRFFDFFFCIHPMHSNWFKDACYLIKVHCLSLKSASAIESERHKSFQFLIELELQIGIMWDKCMCVDCINKLEEKNVDWYETWHRIAVLSPFNCLTKHIFLPLPAYGSQYIYIYMYMFCSLSECTINNDRMQFIAERYAYERKFKCSHAYLQ
jgi:hypothetical protein